MLSFQAESRNLLLFLNCEIFRDVSASLDMTKAQNLSSADAATAWVVCSTITAN